MESGELDRETAVAGRSNVEWPQERVTSGGWEDTYPGS